MTDELVVVRDLRKSFMHMGRELEVLRGIDLTIRRGEVLAIVGPSGAGKSTLLHCIGTLDLPTTGSIALDDNELVGLAGSKLAAIRNRAIGFVFQFHHLLPEFNALENVMMPGLIQGLARGGIEKRARELLEEVGLGHRISHRPGELSGGEQQRVALARALVLEPKLILADEPTGNLDSATSDAIHQLFFEINEKHGTTIVVVTHNNAFAESMPRVVGMVDGKVDTDTKGPESVKQLDEALVARQQAMQRAVPGRFWRRAGAQALDALFTVVLGLTGVVLVSMALAQAVDPSSGASQGPNVARLLRTLNNQAAMIGAALAGVVGPLVYRVVAEKLAGATLGKLLLGLRVRSEALGPIGWRGALVRNVALFAIDTLFFGLIAYMAMSGSLMRQRLGDRWGHTVVVRDTSVDDTGRSPAVGLLLAVALCVAVSAGFHYAALKLLGG
jgi:lipoprotein-releasing system ATP-binding protein